MYVIRKKFKCDTLKILAAMLLLCIPALSAAQDNISVKDGEFEVFYSAFNTSFLKPDVARAAGVVRAADRGLLNISIVQHGEEGKVNVPAAEIAGESYNLLHRRKLEFNELVEPGARYYLAPFKIANDDELIVFDVEVRPLGSARTISFQFKQRFFHNP
ncbi:MAG: DUF4426 domain-containing protein [Pseudomonadales bacterium]